MSPARRRQVARKGGKASKNHLLVRMLTSGHKNAHKSTTKKSTTGRSRQGFASMSPARIRKIAAKGGRASRRA
jgi:general stress protein YciG